MQNTMESGIEKGKLKRILILGALVFCLGLGWVMGRRTYTVPSIAFLASQKEAKFYDLNGGVTPDNLIGELDVSQLTPLLATATWRSGGISVNKGEFHLLFADGTHLRWRAPGTYFLVDGWPGYFVFPKNQHAAAQDCLQQLMKDEIVPWREARHAGQKAATQTPSPILPSEN